MFPAASEKTIIKASEIVQVARLKLRLKVLSIVHLGSPTGVETLFILFNQLKSSNLREYVFTPFD